MTQKYQKTAHQSCSLKRGKHKQSAGVPSPVQQEPERVSGHECVPLSACVYSAIFLRHNKKTPPALRRRGLIVTVL